MASLGSRHDNQKNTHKIIIDGGNSEVATRVDDPITHDKLDSVITALGGAVSVTPTIINFTAVAANTEYSQALPASNRKFLIQARGMAKLKLAYAIGDTSINYITINPGVSFVDDNFYSSQTIYFTSSVAGEVIEIITYA